MKTIITILSIFSFGIFSFTASQLPAGTQTERLRSIYLSQLGVREATNRNDGPQVEAYLCYVGLKPGNPWCAAYVSWCLGQAGIANPRSGYCPQFFPSSKVVWKKELKVESVKLKGGKPRQATDLPRTGDVFGLYFPEKGRIAHVGFIDEWGEKYAITCEGNTNEAGSREGDGVYRKRRLITSIYKVARYLSAQ